MKHRYLIFKSPSFFDLTVLEYIKTRICTQHEIAVEVEELNKTAKNCHYWFKCDEQYKPTEE